MSNLRFCVRRLAPALIARSQFSTCRAVQAAMSERKPEWAPPYGPVGVERALERPPSEPVASTLFTKEFSLADRVAFVTGANRGIGLEAALTFLEAGARAVYTLDLPKEPGEEWKKVKDYAARLGSKGRLEYISGDVRDQEAMWKVGENIGDKEGRLDVCVANAGVFMGDIPVLEHKAEQFQKGMDINASGTVYTAQAAGRQMVRFGNGGSIILISSMCGTIALEPVVRNVSYHGSKGAVLQIARSMACELGREKIRVNTVSPGWIHTKMTTFLNETPELGEYYATENPLGRIGRPEELRGVFAWLASDASSFCTGSDILVDGGHHAW